MSIREHAIRAGKNRNSAHRRKAETHDRVTVQPALDILLRLQRQRGNRFVQRVVSLGCRGVGETSARTEVGQAVYCAQGDESIQVNRTLDTSSCEHLYAEQLPGGMQLRRRQVAHALPPTKTLSQIDGIHIQLYPMRHGHRTRILEVHWCDNECFRRRVSAAVRRQLGVPNEWDPQLMDLSNLGRVYEELFRENPLRPDGEIVRISAEFSARGEVGYSTLRFNAVSQAPAAEAELAQPEDMPDEALGEAEIMERLAHLRPVLVVESVPLSDEALLSDEEVIRLIESGDPDWRAAFDVATSEIIARSVLGMLPRGFYPGLRSRIARLLASGPQVRQTPQQVLRELLDRTRYEHGRLRRAREAASRREAESGRR